MKKKKTNKICFYLLIRLWLFECCNFNIGQVYLWRKCLFSCFGVFLWVSVERNACSFVFTKFIFSCQKEEDDGGDMDSYQVLLLLLSILWHGAQLMLIASNFQMNKRTGASKSGFEIHKYAVHLRGYLGYKTLLLQFTSWLYTLAVCSLLWYSAVSSPNWLHELWCE